MKTAYHFTTWENWVKIRVQGLIPYKLKPDLQKFYGKRARAIYAWPGPLNGNALIGQVIHRGMDLRSWHVVRLKFTYMELASFPGDDVTHDGELNGWVYHERVPMLLVKDHVPPDRIELHAEWNLRDFICSLDRMHPGYV